MEHVPPQACQELGVSLRRVPQSRSTSWSTCAGTSWTSGATPGREF